MINKKVKIKGEDYKFDYIINTISLMNYLKKILGTKICGKRFAYSNTTYGILFSDGVFFILC